MSISDSDKPLIVVTGATGLQGGSVARFLLEDGGFRVRAITRNTESDKARELKEKGAEVVKADFNDLASLIEVFRDAYGVFAVTNFWDATVLDEEKEYEHGKALVDAAVAVGVKHFIFSSLERWPLLVHFNSKARANDYLIASGIPRTTVYTSFYFENFIGWPAFMFRNIDGEGAFTADWDALETDGPLPGFAVGDLGGFVLGAFKDPTNWIGKDIKITEEIFTPRQFVAAVEEIASVKIHLKEVDSVAFKASMQKADPATKELYLTFDAFYETKGVFNRTPEEIEAARQLYPQQRTMKDFIRENIDKILPI